MILWNKLYLLGLIVLLGGVLLGCLRLKSLLDAQTNMVQSFNLMSREFNKLQDCYVNLLGYNWVQVVSLDHELNMTLPNLLYEEAIEGLQNTNIIQMIKAHYPEGFANELLYGDICGHFVNTTFCETFRNGIFKSGLSMALPLIVK